MNPNNIFSEQEIQELKKLKPRKAIHYIIRLVNSKK